MKQKSDTKEAEDKEKMQRVDELEKEIMRNGETMTEMKQKHGERVDMMEARIQEIAKQTQESITDIINLMERALKQDPKPYQKLREEVNAENLQELREAFRETDENENGHLDFQEAADAMEYLGFEDTAPTEMRLILGLLPNSDEQIDESRFVNKISKHRGNEMQITKFLEKATLLCEIVERQLLEKEDTLAKTTERLIKSKSRSE